MQEKNTSAELAKLRRDCESRQWLSRYLCQVLQQTKKSRRDLNSNLFDLKKNEEI
jgi:hypothetical protein